jgi:hypothetical protein
MSNAVSNDSQYIVPLYAALDASGSATMNVVQLERVSMPYDEKYDLTLSEAESADLLNGFVLTHVNGVVLGATAARGDAAWKAVLQKVIEDAQNAGGESLSDNLYNQLLTTFKSIFEDNIANMLQDNWSLSVTVNAVGGAANMWTALGAAPDACRLLAQQIPNSNYLLYSDASENMLTNALPMKNDDKIVFIFNLATNTVARNILDIQKAATFTPPADVTPSDSATNQNSAPAVATATFSASRVAFFVTVAGAGEDGKVTGLTAAAQTVDQTSNPASGGSGGSTSGAVTSSL